MARKRTGSLHYDQRRRDWFGVFTVNTDELDANGKPKTTRKWIALNASTRTLAERKLAAAAGALASGNWVATTKTPDTAKPATVEEWALAWADKRETQGKVSARDERMWIVRHIAPHIGKLALVDVRPQQLRAVLDAAVSSKLTKESVRKVHAVMGRFFAAAWADELLHENPMERVSPPEIREVRKERVILSDEELGQLLDHADVDLELKVLCAVARTVGGMRTGDLNTWDWAMVDRLHFAQCVVPRAKTATPQVLEIPESLRGILAAWWERHDKPATGPVFPARRGDRAGQFKATRGISYAPRLRRALWTAGVVRMEPVVDEEGNRHPSPADPLYFETAATMPVDFHSFRRAYNTALATAGVNVQTAMGLAGHSDAATHTRYVMRAGRTLALPEAAIPLIPRFVSFRGANDSEETSDGSGVISSATQRIRTSDLRLRRPSLYPAELVSRIARDTDGPRTRAMT